MNEQTTMQPKSPENNREQMKAEYFALAKELAAHPEGVPFPGITSAAREAWIESQSDPAYAEYMTPIDQLLQKYQDAGGMEISLGNSDPNKPNIHVRPKGSPEDALGNEFPLRDLNTDAVADERLKRLIQLDKDRRAGLW